MRHQGRPSEIVRPTCNFMLKFSNSGQHFPGPCASNKQLAIVGFDVVALVGAEAQSHEMLWPFPPEPYSQ